MPTAQPAAVAAARQDSCSYHCCTVSYCSPCYRRSTGNGQHCSRFGFPLACLLHRQSCPNRRPVAAAVDGDDETADDCYNAVAAVDNADSVAQWMGPCDKLFHRGLAKRSFCRRHHRQIVAGSAIVVVAAVAAAAVAGIVAAAELPAVAVGGSVAVGSILDDLVDFRWPRNL